MATQSNGTTKTVISKRAWWIVGGILVGIALIMLVCAMTWGMARRAALMDGRFDNRSGGRMGSSDRFERGGMMGGNFTSDSSRVSGVVTAVDGNTLTVAGYGKTKNVITNDSTTYFGAAQPVKVNDTVMIVGSTSNDTLTAGRIVIQRQ